MTQSKTFLERIKSLQNASKKEKIDGYFVDHSEDLFYLTGLKLSLGYLFILSNKARLFVDGRYLEIAKKNSPIPVEELNEENQLAFIKGAKKLGFNADKMTHSGFLAYRKVLRKTKTKLFPNPDLIEELRLIKDHGEIQKMKESAKFAYDAYQMIRKKLAVDITEIELAKELEIYCLRQGAEKMSFEPIIAFGKNTSLPHHHPGNTKLKKNDIALFDLGVVLDGYCSDMTRVDFVGKIDPKLKHIYDVNRAAQKVALAKCKPGVFLKELDIAARRVMEKEGLEKYFIHGLGHGIGLEVHESPSIKKTSPDRNLPLEEGMVITIEPGIYLPGKGGVRYEDTIVITRKGYMNFYPEI